MDRVCGGLCMIAVIGAVLYIVVVIFNAYEKHIKLKKEEEEKILNEKNGRIRRNTNTINSNVAEFRKRLADYFTDSGSISGFGLTKDIISLLMNNINNIKEANERLKEDDPSSGRDSLISELTQTAEQLQRFLQRVRETSFRIMINPDKYGKIDNAYWNEVLGMDATTVERVITEYNTWLKNGQTNRFDEIDIQLIPAIVWFYANERPYSAQKFAFARQTFYYFFKGRFVDFTIAEFYAIKQMGDDELLRDKINLVLTSDKMINKNSWYSLYFTSYELTLLASGLMWMHAYDEEKAILQYMLKKEQLIPPQAQERLRLLSAGGGNTLAGLDVVSDETKLYFDVSALAWKDEEYNVLFENLTFHDKLMYYSLAVRDEDKELLISQGIQVPDLSTILKQIKEAFSRDYGGSADATLMNCIALSGGGKEKMDCILAQSVDCKQMGLLMHIVRIGKKLTIKFYTLFMPMGTNLAEQKQQALSLLKKLSPTVTSWESSMKDLSLEAVQQLLNSASQEPERVPPVDVDSDKKEVPIF